MKDEKIINEADFDEIYTNAFHIAKQIQAMQHDAYKNPRVYDRK